MQKILFVFFFLFSIESLCAQKIQLFSSTSHQPVEDVMILTPEGKMVGQTDALGFVNLDSMSHDFYLLSSPQVSTDTLFVQPSVSKYYVPTVSALETVVLSSHRGRYAFLEGYYVSYVTRDNVFNIFVDGKMTQVFDTKTGEMKGRYLTQYRSFILPLNRDTINSKELSTLVFDNFIEFPKFKIYNRALSHSNRVRMQYNADSSIVNYATSDSEFMNKPLKFFGFRFSEFVETEGMTLKNKGNISPKNMQVASYLYSFNAKRKSSEHYTALVSQAFFYPLALHYSEDKKVTNSVSFKRKESNYQDEFWNHTKYVSLYNLLHSQFKDEMKEQKNVATK